MLARAWRYSGAWPGPYKALRGMPRVVWDSSRRSQFSALRRSACRRKFRAWVLDTLLPGRALGSIGLSARKATAMTTSDTPLAASALGGGLRDDCHGGHLTAAALKRHRNSPVLF